MKIKTPDGMIYDFDECEFIEDDIEDNAQKELAEQLFKNTGILVADVKGGEKLG